MTVERHATKVDVPAAGSLASGTSAEVTDDEDFVLVPSVTCFAVPRRQLEAWTKRVASQESARRRPSTTARPPPADGSKQLDDTPVLPAASSLPAEECLGRTTAPVGVVPPIGAHRPSVASACHSPTFVASPTNRRASMLLGDLSGTFSPMIGGTNTSGSDSFRPVGSVLLAASPTKLGSFAGAALGPDLSSSFPTTSDEACRRGLLFIPPRRLSTANTAAAFDAFAFAGSQADPGNHSGAPIAVAAAPELVDELEDAMEFMQRTGHILYQHVSLPAGLAHLVPLQYVRIGGEDEDGVNHGGNAASVKTEEGVLCPSTSIAPPNGSSASPPYVGNVRELRPSHLPIDDRVILTQAAIEARRYDIIMPVFSSDTVTVGLQGECCVGHIHSSWHRWANAVHFVSGGAQLLFVVSVFVPGVTTRAVVTLTGACTFIISNLALLFILDSHTMRRLSATVGYYCLVTSVSVAVFPILAVHVHPLTGWAVVPVIQACLWGVFFLSLAHDATHVAHWRHIGRLTFAIACVILMCTGLFFSDALLPDDVHDSWGTAFNLGRGYVISPKSLTVGGIVTGILGYLRPLKSVIVQLRRGTLDRICSMLTAPMVRLRQAPVSVIAAAPDAAAGLTHFGDDIRIETLS